MQIERRHFTTLNSTNTWSKQNAHTFFQDRLTIVTADAQTAGRGRFNRRWESPPNQNIYATFNFFVEKLRQDIGNIPQLLALSTALMLENQGFHPQLKWPNDVLLSGKKVAGILCETTSFSDHLCVVLGIGLNVNMPLDLLRKIDRPATSLLQESGKLFEVDRILNFLIDYFQRNLDKYIECGFPSFLDLYISKLIHRKGDVIQFHDNLSLLEGKFHSINADGSLNLLLPSGEVKKFIAGEILPIQLTI